jgi:hypothetical protein
MMERFKHVQANTAVRCLERLALDKTAPTRDPAFAVARVASAVWCYLRYAVAAEQAKPPFGRQNDITFFVEDGGCISIGHIQNAQVLAGDTPAFAWHIENTHGGLPAP